MPSHTQMTVDDFVSGVLDAMQQQNELIALLTVTIRDAMVEIDQTLMHIVNQLST